jgi:cytochrome P450
MAISTAAIGVMGLVMAAAALLLNLIRVKVDPREPPVVHPTIPFFGHLIGMLMEGPLYLKKKRCVNRLALQHVRLTVAYSEQCKHPLFTLPMLTGRTYVCTSPTLAVAIQRASSTLDFDILIAQVTPRLVGSDAETANIVLDPTAKEEGRKTMVQRTHHVINPSFALHQISDIAQTQLNHFSDFINTRKDGEEVDLFKCITRALTVASMHTFYGPKNPFAIHPELVEKYWDWDDGMIGYAVGVMPWITARKAHLGIEACIDGFYEYTKQGLHSQARPFLAARRQLHEEVGMSMYQHARLEMGMSFGFNSNASITSFWVVNNIFCRPDLLQEIREEVYNNAFQAPGTISASKLRDSCPLLNSTWRETMRLTAPMTSARVVLEDTILSDTYFLRKGSVVQIAGGVLHSDTEIWGPDAQSFNPRRFYYNWNGTKTATDGSVVDSKANTVHPAAFRGFGGGTSMCPGRHFAQIEITTLAAVMALGFDLQPVQGTEWDPPRDEKRFPLATTRPVRDLKVRLARREGWESVKWDLKA